MTPEQYWQGDVFLVRDYRKAHRMRQDWLNEEKWLQGMYFYEAICDASPIFNPYAKRGTRPHPYPSQPYQIHPPTEEKKVSEEQKQMEKTRRIMDAFASSVNKRMMKKEVSKDGGRPEHD